MFEFTSAKIDIIASALHSPAKWKTEVYSWSSCPVNVPLKIDCVYNASMPVV